MYLSEYLDMFSLTRAERLYYTKHFGVDKLQKEVSEWDKITGLKNK